MKIIKRSGAEAVFDISKIITAIDKANHEVVQGERLTMEEIHDIAQYIEDAGADMRRSLNVEEIQDLVEDRIMDQACFFGCAQVYHIPLSESAGAQVQFDR